MMSPSPSLITDRLYKKLRFWVLGLVRTTTRKREGQKNDNFTISNYFSALNDEEEDDEEVENVYDDSANLVPNTNTFGSSSFTAAAD
ncbi:hypothetical protein Tco_0748969 [Tanacetum coccineum]|uniref:Uncharacterized protein n=1 Tax=Tanacetum coccineum TaxID=301880 RepID=A0ABQ4Z039_9ASTR